MYQNTTGPQANPKLTVNKGEASILHSSTLGRLRGGVEAITQDCFFNWFFCVKGLNPGVIMIMVRVNIVVNRTVVVDSEYVFYRTGCRNVSLCQQQQSYSGLRSSRLGRSYSNYLWFFFNDFESEPFFWWPSVAMDMEMMPPLYCLDNMNLSHLSKRCGFFLNTFLYAKQHLSTNFS